MHQGYVETEEQIEARKQRILKDYAGEVKQEIAALELTSALLDLKAATVASQALHEIRMESV